MSDLECWPPHDLLIREAHEILQRLARLRAADPTPWIWSGKWWTLPSGHRMRRRNDVVQIDAGERIGLSIRTDLLPRGSNGANLPSGVDETMRQVASSLVAWERLEDTTDPFFAIVHTARPSMNADDLLDSWAERVGLLVATAAQAKAPEAEWSVEVRHSMPGRPASVEILLRGTDGDMDLETTETCQKLVSMLPIAHGYTLDGSYSWQAAAQRVRHGLPRFGWVAIGQRTHFSKPVHASDPIGIMRVLSEGPEIMASAGDGLALDHLFSEIDLSDADRNARQDAVDWDPADFDDTGNVLAAMIDVPGHDPHHLATSIGMAAAFSHSSDVVYRHRRIGRRTRWFPDNPFAYTYDAALTTAEAKALVGIGILEIDDDDRLVLSAPAKVAAVASRAWESEHQAGPILPGLRIVGAIGIGMTSGWILFGSDDPVFHAERSSDETAREALGRLQGTEAASFVVRAVAMRTASMKEAAAWFHPMSSEASLGRDELEKRLPEPWATRYDLGWDMANRTREAIGILEARIAIEPDFDVSPYVR